METSFLDSLSVLNTHIIKLYCFSNLRVAIILAKFCERKITKEISTTYYDLQSTILY